MKQNTLRQTYQQSISELQASYVIDILPCGIILLNQSGVIVEANSAAVNILGKALVGKLWSTIMADVINQKDDGHEVSLKNGKRISIDITSLYPISGELIVLNDLTHTREFEEARSSQHRLAEMGKMTAQIAHQIRTPLTSATLYLDQLGNKQLTEIKRQEILQHMKECHANIENQLRDMLTFAKGGATPLSAISIHEFCSQIIDETSILITKYNTQIKVVCEPDVMFQGHIKSLQGAIINLITNSLQANASLINFIVKLIAKQKINYLEFIIQDNGNGMPENIQQQAVQPFFTTRSNGIGLGLGVVQAVIQAHAGECSIESEPGKGTKICLRIPWLMPQ